MAPTLPMTSGSMTCGWNADERCGESVQARTSASGAEVLGPTTDDATLRQLDAPVGLGYVDVGVALDSRPISARLGAISRSVAFADQLSRGDETLRNALQFGWEQVVEGILPVELSIDQMPRRIQVAGSQYQLSYKAIIDELSGRSARRQS